MPLHDIKRFTSDLDDFIWPDRDRKQRLKRQRILLAATDLFVRLGYRKTSVDNIAHSAGVAKGTIYLYYKNKAEIVYHAIALEKRSHLDSISKQLSQSHSAAEQLKLLLANGIIMSQTMPLTRGLIQGDREIELALLEMDDSVLSQVAERQLALLMDLLNTATGKVYSAVQLQQRAHALADIVVATATSQQLNSQQLPWQDYADIMADVMVNGVLGNSPKLSTASTSNV